MPNVLINGKNRYIDGVANVADLLNELKMSIAGTAVAVNEEIINKDEHAQHILKEGDRVEIIRAIGGG